MSTNKKLDAIECIRINRYKTRGFRNPETTEIINEFFDFTIARNGIKTKTKNQIANEVFSGIQHCENNGIDFFKIFEDGDVGIETGREINKCISEAYPIVSTANKYKSVLKTVGRWYNDEMRNLPTLPPGFECLKKERTNAIRISRDDFFTWEEICKTIDENDIRMKAILAISFSGARPDAIKKLQLKHINYIPNETDVATPINITIGDKNAHQTGVREIPIIEGISFVKNWIDEIYSSDHAKENFSDLSEASFCCSLHKSHAKIPTGKQLQQTQITVLFNRAFERAGFGDRPIKTGRAMRKSFANDLAKQHTPFTEMCRNMGWIMGSSIARHYLESAESSGDLVSINRRATLGLPFIKPEAAPIEKRLVNCCICEEITPTYWDVCQRCNAPHTKVIDLNEIVTGQQRMIDQLKHPQNSAMQQPVSVATDGGVSIGDEGIIINYN